MQEDYQYLPLCGSELYPLHPNKTVYGIYSDSYKFVKIITDKTRQECLLEVKLQKQAKNLGINCPIIYDYYWYGGVFYIIMEKVQGKTIKDLYSKNVKKVPKKVMSKIREIVDYLYENGIEYVDVTSVNFMITKDNQIMVIDFGHAYYSDGKTIDAYLDDFLDGKNYWNPEMI
jgi:Kae1-associated kinase Bud32